MFHRRPCLQNNDFILPFAGRALRGITVRFGDPDTSALVERESDG